MEWKHLRREVIYFLHFAPPHHSLGNFLSGMETRVSPRPRRGRTSLGNFLSGMETQPGEAQQVGCRDLGNFLSGMETSRAGGCRTGSQIRPWKLP